MINFLWNLRQQIQIAEAAGRASEANMRSTNNHLHWLDYGDALERLALVNQAMWELLHEHVGISEQELIDKVNEIDLRDGKADGRLVPASRTHQCGKCNRTFNSQRRACIYCGEPAPPQSPFNAT